MSRFIVLVLAGLILWGGACLGAGPKAVAVADRSLWPRSMQSADDFDQASRAEILGLFFVLGNAFKARLDQTVVAPLQELYKEQCVGSHGQKHTSHQTLKTWKESLDVTQGLVHTAMKDNVPRMYFRPPYGQRTEALTQYVQAAGSAVMLWNLDSKDWSGQITASQVTDRIVTLMLLWRRGILLFHDVHNKVHTAVPALAQFAQATGLTWQNCRALH